VENQRTLWVMGQDEKVPASAGMALFPQEIARPPREWGERSYHIRRWEEMPRGGHFAALEEPELLAREVRAFFRQFRYRHPGDMRRVQGAAGVGVVGQLPH